MRKFCEIAASVILIAAFVLLISCYELIFTREVKYLDEIGASGMERTPTFDVCAIAIPGFFALTEIYLSQRYFFIRSAEERKVCKTVDRAISLILAEMIIIGQAFIIKNSFVMGRLAEKELHGIFVVFNSLSAYGLLLVLAFTHIIMSTISKCTDNS